MSNLHKVDTPFGVFTWEGDLSLGTVLTFPDGAEGTFYSLLSLSQGEAAKWFRNTSASNRLKNTLSGNIDSSTHRENLHG